MENFILRSSGYGPKATTMTSGSWGMDVTSGVNPWNMNLDPCDIAGHGDMDLLEEDLEVNRPVLGRKKYFSFSRDGVRTVRDPEYIKNHVLLEGWKDRMVGEKKWTNGPRWEKHMRHLSGDEDKAARKAAEAKAAEKPVEAVEKPAKKIPHRKPLIREIFLATLLTVMMCWCTYFGVEKAVGPPPLARAILNAIPANDWMRQPPPINLGDPPRAIKLMAKKMIPKVVGPKGAKKVGRRGIIILSVDIRHYYHQIGTCDFLRSFFGLCWKDPKSEVERFFQWENVPMGWNYAPYVSQCIGWHLITHENDVFKDGVHKDHKTPPMFLNAHDTDGNFAGMVFLYIDNIHAYFLDSQKGRKAADKFLRNLLRNCEWYKFQVKYAFVDGQEMEWDFKRKDDCKKCEVVLRKGSKKLEFPEALGVEFSTDVNGLLQWRIKEQKIGRLPKKLRRADLDTPRAVSRVVGRILYRRQLDPTRHDSRDLLKILSRAGQYQHQHKSWDAKGFVFEKVMKENGELDYDEWTRVEQAHADLLNNSWYRGAVYSRQRDLVVAASDASKKHMGWVIYGKVKPDYPSLVPHFFQRPTLADARRYHHETFEATHMAEWHIYLKEVYAACEVVKQVSREYSDVEILVGIDNTAAKASLNRGISVNDVAYTMIQEALHAAELKGNLVTGLGVPGHYNIADWPSRVDDKGNPYPLPSGEVKKPLKSGMKVKLETEFDPWLMTWTVMRDEYSGRRLDLGNEVMTKKMMPNDEIDPWEGDEPEEDPEDELTRVYDQELESILVDQKQPEIEDEPSRSKGARLEKN